MPITYTLKIADLQVLPQYEGYADVVWVVGWNYYGTDGSLTTGVSSTTTLDLTLGCNVTPFSDLSENTVMSWVMRDTDPAVWTAAQQQINEWFQQQYAQSAVSMPPPWSGQPETEA